MSRPAAKPRRRSAGPPVRDVAGVPVRVAAVRVIEAMLAGQGSLTRLLPAAQATLPDADRSLLQAYAFGLARWSVQLDALLESLMERPLKKKDADVHILLQLGLFQLLHTRTAEHAAVDATVAATRALEKPWARGLVNAVLRNAVRRRDSLLESLDENARLAHPAWLLKRLAKDWPEQWREIAQANNQQAPMVLRVNLRVGTREAYQARLAEAGYPAVASPSAPTALIMERPTGVESLPGFREGDVSVQDAAAQLAVPYLIEAVSSGARLLDACAAPGGKTAQALESGHFGDVLALDQDATRLTRVEETLVRLNLTERVTLRAADAGAVDEWWDGVPFDGILLDAPCTGTGVIRRHPDIKLLRRSSDVAALAAEQGRLLDQLWKTLAPGGSLLYVTCSILRSEGEDQLAEFLLRQSNASLVHERRVLPGEGASPDGQGGMDGFYHALLVRHP